MHPNTTLEILERPLMHTCAAVVLIFRLVMDVEETRKMSNVEIFTNISERKVRVNLRYPAIYTFWLALTYHMLYCNPAASQDSSVSRIYHEFITNNGICVRSLTAHLRP